MFDKLKENLEHNLDHQLIDVHQQVNQVIYRLLPKIEINFNIKKQKCCNFTLITISRGICCSSSLRRISLIITTFSSSSIFRIFFSP